MRAERGDRLQSVDRQLLQSLQIAAFAAELLDEEARVGDLQLGKTIDGRGRRRVSGLDHGHGTLWPGRYRPAGAAL
jgi:hypothetical protein